MPAEIQGFPNGTTSTTNYNLIGHDNLIVHVLQYPSSRQCLQKSKAPKFSSSQTDGTTFTTNSASAAIQEAVAQAQAASGMSEGNVGSETLPEATQILLQAAADQAEALIHQGLDGTQITMEGATSEQAALVLQHLAAENAQVGTGL